METGFYLTALVFAVAALHLITRGVDSYRRKFKASETTTSKARVKRSDWYMFFYCSTLTGKSGEKKAANVQDRDISANLEKKRVKDSRPSLRRTLA